MHFMAWAAKNGAIAELRTGSAIPHLTGVRLKTLELIWPESDVQQQTAARLDDVQQSVKEMQSMQAENISVLHMMEEAILAQAFRGE
jgi:restriction endonuclease S subunit